MPPAIAFGIHHDYLAGYDAAEHFTVGSINHSAISQLAWSVSGHTIDDDLSIPSDIQIVFGSQAETWIGYNSFQERLQIDVSSNGYYLYIIGDTETTGDIFLPDTKHVAFGNTSALPDASIGWNASGYLDIQSADTRFSGTIAIPATADANTGVIEQPAGTTLIHTFGTSNLFIGPTSGNFAAALTGNKNIGIGEGTLTKVTSGINNMAIGTQSLTNCLNGQKNVGVGVLSLFNTTSGNFNVGVGESALYTSQTGFNNIGIGFGALYSCTLYNNVGIGHRAGYTISSGWGNICIGAFSGYNHTTEDRRLIIDDGLASGAARGTKTDEINNSIIYGVMADTAANQTLAINAHATAISYNGLYLFNEGTDNYGIGSSNLFEDLISGTNNYCIGNGTGINITTGEYNYLIGKDAGAGITTESYNLLIGSLSGSLISSGFNTGIGATSLWKSAGGSGYNVAIGYGALAGSGAGTKTYAYNVGVGVQCGYLISTATYNTFLGYRSGYNTNDENYNIFIGSFAGYNQTTTGGLFIVDAGDQDGTQRASAAAEATNSILYGEMKATPATQTLRTNCSIYIREGQDNGDIAGYGQLYCKDNAGTTELWFVNDAGTETKIA